MKKRWLFILKVTTLAFLLSVILVGCSNRQEGVLTKQDTWYWFSSRQNLSDAEQNTGSVFDKSANPRPQQIKFKSNHTFWDEGTNSKLGQWSVNDNTLSLKYVGESAVKYQLSKISGKANGENYSGFQMKKSGENSALLIHP